MDRLRSCLELQLSEVDALSSIFSAAGEFSVDDLLCLQAVKSFVKDAGNLPMTSLRLTVKLNAPNSVRRYSLSMFCLLCEWLVEAVDGCKLGTFYRCCLLCILYMYICIICCKGSLMIALEFLFR